MKIGFASSFVRKLKKFEKSLQEEVLEKVELFEKDSKNPSLKIHKLKGSLKGSYSFSVNYKYRIVFDYISKEEVRLLSVGDHDVYSC
jgi:addiction module RelE/StbE family toxin